MCLNVTSLKSQLEEGHSFQVLFNDHVHNHLKHDLDVGGVGCRGEVVVDELLGVVVERDESVDDEACGRIDIAVHTCRYIVKVSLLFL